MGHHELQTAADSVAMSAALVLQNNGLDTAQKLDTHGPALRGNTRMNPQTSLVFQQDLDNGYTNISVALNTKVDPAMGAIQYVGPLPIQARAVARVREHHLDDVTEIIPRMVLVLDFSGSMSTRDGGGGLNRLQVLRDAVFMMMNMGLNIEYGMVQYSSDVSGTVGISPASENAIKQAMISLGAGGSTNTGAGLIRGGQLYAGTEDEGRHILLVTDGYPCCDSNSDIMAINAGLNLRQNSDISIYVLDIFAHTGFHSSRRIAGPKNSNHPDPSYYFQARNSAELMHRLRSVITSMICSAGPLDPAPQTESVPLVIPPRASATHRVFAFIRSPSGQEWPAEAVYEPSTRMLKLTDADSCDRILDQNHILVVRYDMPTLGL